MAKIVLNFVVSNSSALKKHLINYDIYLRKYSKDKNSLNIESNLENLIRQLGKSLCFKSSSFLALIQELLEVSQLFCGVVPD